MRASPRSSELTPFARALCRVLQSEVDNDGRSPEQIATLAGTGKHSLRPMISGVIVMRVENLHRVCEVLGLPLWAMVRAAENEAADPQLQPVSDECLDLLRHAVGVQLGKPRSSHGLRNYFCAVVGGDYAASWEQLVELGFAERGSLLNDGSWQRYHVTRSGCQLIRLIKAATQRALKEASDGSAAVVAR